ncbi:LOW QUALITY PROTEIN: uncharacterized protein EMH_0042790 [Eimeria mitis]|uniref:Uncharacterized protein n=1 Tax=Eimeria mitis TaxID=44415 RepID=U6K3D4_9EIME|nr:LOW QUALITY PROTEIN: uncharacterized protein EMH_0042790 [Eimeria mitis]CDJ32194.1 hypothetical protein, conserved [Eimeria mitis]
MQICERVEEQLAQYLVLRRSSARRSATPVYAAHQWSCLTTPRYGTSMAPLLKSFKQVASKSTQILQICEEVIKETAPEKGEDHRSIQQRLGEFPVHLTRSGESIGEERGGSELPLNTKLFGTCCINNHGFDMVCPVPDPWQQSRDGRVGATEAFLQSAWFNGGGTVFSTGFYRDDIFAFTRSWLEAAPCFPQASTGTTFSPLRGVGNTYTSTVTDALGQQDVSELPLESLRWTEPMAHVLEQATAPQHPGEPALRSSAGKWKEDGGDFPGHPWFTPSWVPYDVSHRNHFGSRATGFDATLRQSRSACERTETRKETVLGEAAQLNLQHIIGGSSLPMGEADVASVVPGSDAAKSPQDLMPVETDPVNLPEMADDQTTATAFRSRKIAEIANMLSLAAEEFERGLKGVQERLEPVSCGQFIAQGQPHGDAPVQRILSQSPMCSSGAGCGASQPIQPLMMSSPAYSGDSGRLGQASLYSR